MLKTFSVTASNENMNIVIILTMVASWVVWISVTRYVIYCLNWFFHYT